MIHTLESVIKDHPFFDRLAGQHLQFITACAKNARFAEGNTIFVGGDPADEFCFIQKGSVSIELTVPAPDRKSVRTAGPGEILGWSWVSPPYHRHFNGGALELTSAIAFDAQCLRSKCELDHDLGYEMLKRFATVIVERLDAAQVQLLDVYGKT